MILGRRQALDRMLACCRERDLGRGSDPLTSVPVLACSKAHVVNLLPARKHAKEEATHCSTADLVLGCARPCPCDMSRSEAFRLHVFRIDPKTGPDQAIQG